MNKPNKIYRYGDRFSVMNIEDNVNWFINGLINPENYNILPLVATNNSTQTVNEDDIYKAIISSKFRKTKITPEAEIDIRSKIHSSVLNNEAIQFSVPFGGYKAWRLELDFAPDWAEVFNVAYLMRYATHIIKVYPYGVHFNYTYQGGIMYCISDTPKDKAENYYIVFKEILGLFNKLSDKVRFDLVDISNLYNSKEEYYIDFIHNFLDNLVNWDSKYDSDICNRHFLSAMHNVYLYGNRDLANQTEYIKGKYYFFSALMTDAVDCLSKRRLYNKDSNNIQLVCVKGPSKCINIGACETSTVHFWVGRGFLKQNKGVIKPYIYTYSNVVRLISGGTAMEILVDSPFKKFNNNLQKILYLLR